MWAKHWQKKVHQQKRLWQGTRRIPAMVGIVGASLVHIDTSDEAAATAEQQLPNIGERRRLTERLIPICDDDDPLAVYWSVFIEFYYGVYLQNYYK